MITVMTHGTFDILHYGHIEYLKKARSLGDKLIVSLSSDALARAYGKDPVNNYAARKKVLESIRYVDKVVKSESVSREALAEKNKADIYVTSSIYKCYDFSKYKCKVVFIEPTPNISSTRLKEKIKEKEICCPEKKF